jgi:hypothetical protein
MLVAVTDVFINERKQKFSEWMPNIVASEIKVCWISKSILYSLLSIGLECSKRTRINI